MTPHKATLFPGTSVSDDRYSSLFHLAPVGFLTISEQEIITEANPATARFLNLTSPEELPGKSVFEFVNKAYSETLTKHLSDVFLNRCETPVFEAEFIRADGSSARGEIVVVPANDKENGPVIMTVTDVTDRRRTHDALVKARNDWESTFNAIPDLIAVIDNDHRIVKVNKAMAEKLGCLTQNLTNCDCFKVIHGLHAAPEFCPHARSIDTGKEEQSEMEQILFGGICDVTRTPLFDEQGRRTGSVHVSRDISMRRKKEQLMIENLALGEFALTHPLKELLALTIDKVELLTDSTIGFFHFLDDNEVCVSLQTWSTNTLKHHCQAENNAQHYPVAMAGVWVDCIHERRPVIHNDYESLLHKRGLPAGHTPIVRELTVPIMRGGKIVAVIGVGNKLADYTEDDIEIISSVANLAWEYILSKRYEESLALSDQYARALLDAIPDLIFRLNRDGVYLDYKAQPDQLYYRESSIIGKNNRDLTPPDFAELVEEKIKLTLATGKMVVFEYQLPVPGTEPRYFEARMVPSGPDEVVAISRDITDQKKSEMDLKNKIDQLELLNRVMIDREIRMIELKKEVNGILVNEGKGEKYIIHESTAEQNANE
jgi:PAS domain S-box-containing protein